MITLNQPIPRDIVVAFSGGVDSVAITTWLSNNHRIKLAFFHHDTYQDEQALAFTQSFAHRHNLPLEVGVLTRSRNRGESLEEYWREERYAFLSLFDKPVVLGHHLDDCVETYVWSALHGKPVLMPSSRGNCIRPFLYTKKSVLEQYCVRHGHSWFHDASNDDTRHTRNYIRHTMMPHILRVNPGIQKTVLKLLKQRDSKDRDMLLPTSSTWPTYSIGSKWINIQTNEPVTLTEVNITESHSLIITFSDGESMPTSSVSSKYVQLLNG